MSLTTTWRLPVPDLADLYADVQMMAIAANALGNRERERAFLDVLTVMDRMSSE
jgi:hypothetical protein